jgi:antitoxin PrlF
LELLSNRFGITLEIASNTFRERAPMATTVTSKGQVTIPKHVREALGIKPGSKVTFELNKDGDRVLRKCGPARKRGRDRFEAVLGTADIKWRTDELMALLRGDD